MPKLSKIYNFKEMNSYQFIALVGFIMSLAANAVLELLGKTIENFWGLYICWTILFIIGSLKNLYGKPPEDHHHHHH